MIAPVPESVRAHDLAPQTPAWWPRWLPWLVLAGAATLRVIGAGEWSLWEDEETSVYFSQHPDRPFARGLPVFFLLLRGLYAFTGVSVLAGRLLAAGIGLLTLWLGWRIARRFTNPRVAMAALLLMSVSPAHLFWSQSIRYYGLVLLFELISIYALLTGMATGRLWLLLASNVALVAAIKTHFSAMLLAPVYIAWFCWLAWREGLTGDFVRKTLVFFGLPAVVLATFWQRAYAMLSAPAGTATLGDPVHVLVTAVVYFGPVACVLAAWAGVSGRRISNQFMFFALLAVVPVLELVVIASLQRINVAYYYGFVALFGVAVLAGYGWEAIAPRRRLASLVVVAAGVFHITALAQYYGPGFGDRPRWKDAAAHVRHDAKRADGAFIVYSTVPGSVAFHLGVDPARTMGHPTVRGMHQGAFTTPRVPTYYVVERRTIGLPQQQWLDARCELPATYPSQFLTRDRSVEVFYCPPALPVSTP